MFFHQRHTDFALRQLNGQSKSDGAGTENGYV
jgi:hypothetical protein